MRIACTFGNDPCLAHMSRLARHSPSSFAVLKSSDILSEHETSKEHKIRGEQPAKLCVVSCIFISQLEWHRRCGMMNMSSIRRVLLSREVKLCRTCSSCLDKGFREDCRCLIRLHLSPVKHSEYLKTWYSAYRARPCAVR